MNQSNVILPLTALDCFCPRVYIAPLLFYDRVPPCGIDGMIEVLPSVLSNHPELCGEFTSQHPLEESKKVGQIDLALQLTEVYYAYVGVRGRTDVV